MAMRRTPALFSSASASRAWRAGLVLQADPAEATAVAGDENKAEAFGFVQIHGVKKILGDPLLFQPIGAADDDGGVVDFGGHAASGGLGEILRLDERHAGFTSQLREGLGGGVVAVFFGGGGDAQQFGRGDAAHRGEAADSEFSGGESAGLVKDKRIDLGRQFDVADVLDEDAEAGRGGQGGDHGAGGGENEGAGAGHNEDGGDAAQILGERPDEGAEHEDQRGVKSHVLVDDAHDRQFGLFGGKDQSADAAERGVLARAGDADLDGAGEILRAGKHFVAGFFVHGKRFAGDGGLVERALSVNDGAVGGHVVARADADDVPDGELAGGDFLLAGGGDAAGLGRG